MPVEVWQFEAGLETVTHFDSESGVRVYRLPRFKSSLWAALRVPRSTLHWLRPRLDEIGLFHLHSVFSAPNNFVAGLAKPYAVTPQGGWSPDVIKGRHAALKAAWIRLFEKRLWSSAAFIQAVSPKEASDLKQLPGMTRIETVPNGVDLADSVSRSGQGRHSWLFLGRVAVRQKGLDTLLRAYAEAAREVDDLPPLIIAGPDFRGGVEALKAIARQLGITHKITFPGPVAGTEKTAMFDKASLFLHVSRWEGLPLVMLEALAHGLPCVVTSETGMGEWMKEKECGWVTRPGAESLTALLRRLAQNPDEVRRHGARAREAVSADFAWSKVADRLAALYAEVLGRP
jgi:glycosyltransferase involved in cell wall biosynthesis